MKSLDGAAERMTADVLDRFWDGLTSGHPGGPSRPDELLDPSLQRSVRRLRLVDETPGPDPAFTARLRSELMTTQPAQLAVAAGGRRFGTLARRRVLVELVVAAALLLAVLGGGPVLKLPVSLDPAAPTVAASAAATGSAGFAASGACAQTVTPEPTVAAIGLAPAPTLPPEPSTGAASKPCTP
jgi:hypothetical protein